MNDLEKYTVQDDLCLGDMRALLGRIEGRLKARAVDFEAKCANSPDDISFNKIRSSYWAAIRHIYPTAYSLHALTSLKKGTEEDMHAFLKRCEGVWEDCTGERHDASPAVVMLWKNAVIKALPQSVQACLEDKVGLDIKPIEEWRQHLIHHDMTYQATQRENDEVRKALKLRLLKMQVAEKEAEANKNKKSTKQMAILAEKAGRTPPTVQTQEELETSHQNQQSGGGRFRGRRFQNGGCYTCGQMSHWSKECPTQLQQQQAPVYLPTQVQPQAPQYLQQQTPAYLPTQVQPQAQVYPPIQRRGRGGGRFQSTARGSQSEGCFKCGQLTHWSRECPQNIAPNNGPPQSYPRGGFHDYNRGRGSQGWQRGIVFPNMNVLNVI